MDDDEEGRRRYESKEVERRKAEVGMATPGTPQYYKNAKYILSAYTNPNEETREKLRWLRDNGY